MRRGRIWAIGVLVLGLAGCAAGSRPCMIIPAQIELARDARDVARDATEQRRTELARLKSTLEQNEARLAKYKEERDQLSKEVGGTPSEQKQPAAKEKKP